MDRVIRYTTHALNRMESRNISSDKVAQILYFGQVFSADNGKYRAKLQEFTGKSIIRHEVVYAKSENLVITVWKETKPFLLRKEKWSKHQEQRIYKHRKQTQREQEFNTYCREEYEHYNLQFSA